MIPRDRLVSVKGPVFYVQAVLVPELAVRLVIENIGVEDDARRILKKSRHVEEILYVDEEDSFDDFQENDLNWF